MPNTPTEVEIAAHFSAMDDCVAVINEIVADDTKSLMTMDADEVKRKVTRNTGHLEVQAKKDWYSESSNSKTSYIEAVAAGKAYVNE